MAAGAIAGVALQAYGGVKSANDQYNAAQMNIDNLNLQAQEMNYRNNLNIQKQEMAAHTFEQNQAGAFAASGVDVGTGAPLAIMEQTANTVSQEIVQAKRENAFNMNQLRFQTTQEQTQAGQNKLAGYVGAAGQGLLSAVQVKQSITGDKNASKKGG